MARTRRPPARTTCRSPCTHASAATAPGGRSHSPKSVLLPFDRADLVEDHGLVMAHLLAAAEGASVGFGQVHIQDISRLDLPSDRDPVHGDRHLLSLNRSVETLLPASDRLDSTEGPSILTHERLPGSDAPAEDSHAKDRGLRGPEGVVGKEEQLRGIGDLLPARFFDLSFPFVPPGLIVLDQAVDDVALEELHLVVVLKRDL